VCVWAGKRVRPEQRHRARPGQRDGRVCGARVRSESARPPRVRSWEPAPDGHSRTGLQRQALLHLQSRERRRARHEAARGAGSAAPRLRHPPSPGVWKERGDAGAGADLTALQTPLCSLQDAISSPVSPGSSASSCTLRYPPKPGIIQAAPQ